MSRFPVAAALAALALLALPAAAQTPGSSLDISSLPASASTNSTRLALTFQVDFGMSAGSCPGGGAATVNLAATSSNGTVLASVQPVKITYDFGQLDAINGRTFAPATGILLVETPDLVQALTASTVTVTGTSSVACAASAVGQAAPPPESKQATTVVTFKPDVAERIAGGAASEPMPGFELPLVALGLLGAVLLFRRRQA